MDEEPYEDFDLMYEDELELLNDHEYSTVDDSVAKSVLSQSSQKTNTAIEPSQAQIHDDTLDTLNVTEANVKITTETIDTYYIPSTQKSHVSTDEERRKRKAREVFGDIDDLDDYFLESSLTTKKSKKSKEQEELDMIEHILQLRKMAKESQSLVSVSVDNKQRDTERDKRNISYQVPRYPFIGVTRSDRERLYVRFHSEEYEEEEMERLVKDLSFNGLLGEAFKEIWREANELINNQFDTISKPERRTAVTQIVDDTSREKQLWVELYKPRRYLELLSDEGTNRIMLRWMKLWDKVVFGRNPKIKPMKQDNADGKPKFFQFYELNTNLDEHGRPFHKVALLCGPPGLGKTTLAHMVARHAGYNVVEINASDDRSLEAFKTSLENATQMRSVVDQERRPNCLVFDEIDGAPQSSIDFLVKFVNGTAAKKSKKGKTQQQSFLKRPIICICNDVYVPALRPLRQIAFVVNCPPVSTARLAERLMEIARRQEIKTDLGAMMALAEKSNNDIRSCLSILHFFKAQNKPISLSDVYRASIGQKDVQKGIFSVWNDIFQIDRAITKARTGNNYADHKQTMRHRLNKVLQSVSAFGDYDRVAQGVFENYLRLKIKDASFSTVSESLDWFVFSDLVSQQIHTEQIYSLMTYLPYSFAVWHFAFATAAKQKIHFPSEGYEKRMKENRRKALVAEMLRGTQPSTWIYCSRMSLILDILPVLVKIIVPNFRPVSLHLYTPEEKANMLRVVHAMIDYNLNYIQERLPDGTYAYNLEPNVEEIVVFEKTNHKKALSYFNRQLISREIELEKLRKFEAPKTADKSKQTPAKAAAASTAKTPEEKQLPNHLQRLKSKTVKEVKPAVTKDFFGRVIEKASSSGDAAQTHANDIWFKYKEGHNNAVRKTITISYLK